MGASRFRAYAAGMLVDIVSKTEIIPDAYRAYRTVVQDGILFFISKLSIKRLAELLALQAGFKEDVDAGYRLVELARQIPCFHKLGQIIARNRHVDPGIRAWLVQLENGDGGTDMVGLVRMIEAYLGPDLERFRIRVDRTLLSEASVGAVLSFRWRDPHTDDEREGVFKVIKPGVEARLEEEFAILDDLAAYLEGRRHLYALGNLRFRELFGDVKSALREELDLCGEQANLSVARRFYRKNKQIRIPRLAPFSTGQFTAMSRMVGDKVARMPASMDDRKKAAGTLFRAIVCDPLFSVEDAPIFHGDPHGGNIFYDTRNEEGGHRIALLDWSQTGRLDRAWRIQILKFLQGVILDDETVICRAVEALSTDAPEDDRGGFLLAAVRRGAAKVEYQEASMMKKAFVMMEQLSFQGVRFHRDLLLFRKAFFTLDGLLHDLDPEFNFDNAVMAYVRDLLLGELPRRIAGLMLPISDEPEKFASLLSNKDLQVFLLYQAIEFVKKNAHRVIDFMERHAGLFDTLFRLPKLLGSRTVKVLLGLYYLYRMRDAAAET